MRQRGQASIEYLIIVGFVTFLVISIFLIAYIYTGNLQNKIKTNQLETFGNKVVTTAETIFYSGEPSKTTLEVYLPAGVTNITISGNNLIITYMAGASRGIRAYESKVNMTGSINPGPGIKKLSLEAKSDHVEIS